MKLKCNYKPRHPEYKTEEERKKAHNEAQKRYFKKNRETLLEYMRDSAKERYKAKKGGKVRTYKKRNMDISNAEILKRVVALENTISEIMKDHEEVLKDNKKLENLIKWGKR